MKSNDSLALIDLIDLYFQNKRATNAFSKNTANNRKYELKRFNKFCLEIDITNIEDINKNTIIMYLNDLEISKSSKNNILNTLSAFFGFLHNEGIIKDNFVNNIDKPKIYQPKIDILSYDELEKLFQYEARYGSEKLIDRNILMYTLFVDICLRVSEVVNLSLKDVRLDDKEIWIHRKRDKVDKMPINDNIKNKFLNWYAYRSRNKGRPSPWVFLSTHGKKLTPRQVHHIVKKALLRANIHKRKQGPHILRHTGASLKAKAGENLIMIQYLLGHENLNTTKKYLHFNWLELKEMIDRSPVLTENKKELEE